MTGPGNNTYLIPGPSGDAALIEAGVGDPRHLAALARELRAHDATLARVLVTHGHADHASGAPALAAAYPSASFAKYLIAARRGEVSRRLARPCRRRSRGRPDRAAHTRARAGPPRVLARAQRHHLFRHYQVVLGSSVMIDWSRGGDLAQYLAALGRSSANCRRAAPPCPRARARDRGSGGCPERAHRPSADARAAGSHLGAAGRPRHGGAYRRIHL